MFLRGSFGSRGLNSFCVMHGLIIKMHLLGNLGNDRPHREEGPVQNWVSQPEPEPKATLGTWGTVLVGFHPGIHYQWVSAIPQTAVCISVSVHFPASSNWYCLFYSAWLFSALSGASSQLLLSQNIGLPQPLLYLITTLLQASPLTANYIILSLLPSFKAWKIFFLYWLRY